MNQSNVIVKFPKTKRKPAIEAANNNIHYYNGPTRRNVQFLPLNMLLNVLIFIAECLRTMLLTLMLFFRPLIFVICRPLAGLSFIGFILALVMDAHDERLKYIFGIGSFILFLIMYLYDNLLIILSRGNVINVLHN